MVCFSCLAYAMGRGSSRAVVFFAQCVDRAQLGDAYRDKAEAEMIRIVLRVHKGAGKLTLGLVRKTDQTPILGGVCPNSVAPFTRYRCNLLV